jgi:hypothetical protein
MLIHSLQPLISSEPGPDIGFNANLSQSLTQKRLHRLGGV